jgi:hypothetical protein
MFARAHQISLRSILILLPHLCQGLLNGFFLLSFMPSPSHPLPFDYPNNMWQRIQIIKLFIMQPPALSVSHSHILFIEPVCLVVRPCIIVLLGPTSIYQALRELCLQVDSLKFCCCCHFSVDLRWTATPLPVWRDSQSTGC